MDASKDQHKTPIDGSQARVSHSVSTLLALQSPEHQPNPITTDAADRELSHLAFSDPGGSPLPVCISRIPVLKLPQERRPSDVQFNTQNISSGGSNSNLHRPKGAQSRRDSAHRLSACSQSDWTSVGAQQHNTTDSEAVAKQTRRLAVRARKSDELQHALNRQSGKDPVPKAENIDCQNTVKPSPIGRFQPHAGRKPLSLLPKGGFRNERAVRSLLDPPNIQGSVLSTHSSIEVISDGGDQRHLHRQIRATPDAQSTSEDEDHSLAESIASLSPQSANHSLVDELMKARLSARNSEGQSAWFIPKKALRQVVNRDAVRHELVKQLSRGDRVSRKIDSYANRVCEDVQTNEISHGQTKIRTFRKVFALLVLVDSSPTIIRCLDSEHGICDQDLPLTLHRRADKLPELFRRGDKSCEPIKCFSSWSSPKLEIFYQYQWWFLAPFFSPDDDGIVKHYILHDNHILPYIESQEQEQQLVDKMGGYGEVRMVHIHPDHHEFRDPLMCERGFAVKKQIHDEHRTMFKREAEVLRKFSGARSHPHVVSLLATYEQFRKLHLLFYRAQGDLFEYWNNVEPNPNFSYANVLWFATQCAGIADGLSRLHKHLSFPSRNGQSVEHSGWSCLS